MEGHTDVAAYALDWHPSDPIVASGGRDRQILLWNVDSYFNSHGRIPEEEKDLTSTSKDEGMLSNGMSADVDTPSLSMNRIQKSL